MNAFRLAAATAGVLGVALLSVGSASGKPPGINVPCTGQADLVAAINATNSAGGGTINLTRGCDYQLTSVDNSGENGLPVITTSIIINGWQSTIDGTDSVRVFEVDGPGGNLTVYDLTITGGSADVGGGIANFAGTVTLYHSQVDGNSALVAGGGIASASVTPTLDPSDTVATLTLHKSSVSGNQQTLPPGEDENGGLGGGGILNIDGTATLDQLSQVDGNMAQGGVGGGIASGDYIGTGGETTLTVDHSQVNGNTAPHAGGGGIQNLLGSATLNHSQVDGNTSLNGGGIASGNAGSEGTAELRLNHSEVNDNTAIAGPGEGGPPFAAGGIANGSNAVLDHSQVDNNTSPHGIGAGIVNHGMMNLSYSEVNGNTAPASGVLGSAGGILNSQGPPGTTPAVLTIDHSMVSNNSAAGGFGGGIANGVPLPGPISPPGGDLTLTYSAVTGNTAAHGGGIFNHGGTVALSNTSVSGNQVDNCEPTNSIAGCTN